MNYQPTFSIIKIKTVPKIILTLSRRFHSSPYSPDVLWTNGAANAEDWEKKRTKGG